jgi:fructose-bisphosphate aldolase class II
MLIVSHARYCEMLDRAHKEHFAYPAINVSTVDTMNAAIEGLALAESDGFVQVSLEAGTHTSGNLGDSVLGSITLAEHAHRVVERYDINIELHTDHCTTNNIDSFLEPWIAEPELQLTHL